MKPSLVREEFTDSEGVVELYYVAFEDRWSLSIDILPPGFEGNEMWVASVGIDELVVLKRPYADLESARKAMSPLVSVFKAFTEAMKGL